MPAPESQRPAVVVGGWAVAARSGRVRLHHAWPAADGGLSPDAAASLGCALELAAGVRHRSGWLSNRRGLAPGERA